MNCIGPTARSNSESESYWPASVSVITAVPWRPSSAMPKMPGSARPSAVQGVAVGAAVVGLDAADGGDELPGDVAGLVGGVDHGLGPLVGGEGRGGDAAGGGVGDGLGRAALDAGGDLAGRGDAGGGLDGLGGDARCRRGGWRRSCSPADALPAPTPARLAVQAVESRASGTSAEAFCRRLNRVCGHRISPSRSTAVLPQARVVIQRTVSAAVTDHPSSVTYVANRGLVLLKRCFPTLMTRKPRPSSQWSTPLLVSPRGRTSVSSRFPARGQ